MRKKTDANPFKKMPTILFPDELLDKAHRRSEKVANELRKTTRGNSLYKSRIIEEQKIRTAASVIGDYLENIVSKTPSIDNLNPFYRELLEILVDTDEFKKSLGAIQWASDLIKKLGNEYGRKVRRAKSAQETSIIRREFNGRVSSILKRIYPNLGCVALAREKLKNIPTVKDVPTVVIAGYPNVGKSSLLKKLSSAEPEINSYPFTTKGLNIGYMEEGIQIVDTPGILDRPLHERNDIELHAIVALNYLSDIIVYVIDPTEYCGYTIDEQLNLLKEIEKIFPDIPIVIALNKMDIDSEVKSKNIEKTKEQFGNKWDIIEISTNKDKNINLLKRKLLSMCYNEK